MDIQLPQIIYQIVNFSMVVGALSYLLYKPVRKIFEERAERIEAGLKAAEENIAQKNKLEEQQRKVVKDAEKQAVALLEEAKDKAEQRRKQLMTETKQQLEAEHKKMMDEWDAEKQQLIQSMREELVDAVIATSQKVISQTLDKKGHTQLINQEIDALIKTI